MESAVKGALGRGAEISARSQMRRRRHDGMEARSRTEQHMHRGVELSLGGRVRDRQMDARRTALALGIWPSWVKAPMKLVAAGRRGSASLAVLDGGDAV
jgi:hypothetical protein